MPIQIETKRDIVRHTARRVVTAAALAGVMVMSMVLARFGTDLDARITVRDVLGFVPAAGLFISVTVCAVLTYRSGLLMMELTHARRELARVSQTDQLTGLLNRWGFNEAAEAALAVAERSGAPVAIFMCDLDHFKSINDRYGHEIGDHVLAETAEMLREFAGRQSALAGRYGGEEFAVVMVGAGHEQARQYAEDIRRACAGRTVLDGKTPLPITISIGFTVAQGRFDLAELMREADSALYAAKRSGRDRVVEARVAA
jgi:diguanylate cyclase (GGDEF)-like protein